MVYLTRGNGVFVNGFGYGVLHQFISSTEVKVKFRSGFEVIKISDLLPVVALNEVASRFGEREIEVHLPTLMEAHDGELEPEVSEDEASQPVIHEFEAEVEMIPAEEQE